MLPNPGAYTGVKRQLALSSNACAPSSRVLLDEPESWNLWGPTGPCLCCGRQANPHIHRSSSFSSSDEVRVGVCKLNVAAQPALLKFLNRVPENLGAKIVYSI